MNEIPRSIELEVEVPGTPEEVWRAIATGPGITSWYVPHSVEEREGGAAMASFGPGPEMDVPGRVVEWDPPNRVVFDGGEAGAGLAFEWTIEARDGGTCVVRLVNSGFGQGGEWDDQYDDMTEGWRMFLGNLALHLEHFRGESAATALPMAMWPGPRAAAWSRLLDALGLDDQPRVGASLQLGTGLPALRGRVADVGETRLTVLVEEPVPGTVLFAVEGEGEMVGVAVWSYLYGSSPATAAGQAEAAWLEWLTRHGSG